MHPVAASGRYDRALRAVSDLLTRQKLQSVFVGSVARATWLGAPVASGSIDVVVLMAPEQKNQVAMMASNRGFRVDRTEIEESEELDLVPLNFLDAEGEVRVHVLVASNALYARMVVEGVAADAGGIELRVPRAEDYALLLQMSNDVTALTTMVESDGFDRSRYNRVLAAIGLRELVVPE